MPQRGIDRRSNLISNSIIAFKMTVFCQHHCCIQMLYAIFKGQLPPVKLCLLYYDYFIRLVILLQDSPKFKNHFKTYRIFQPDSSTVLIRIRVVINKG